MRHLQNDTDAAMKSKRGLKEKIREHELAVGECKAKLAKVEERLGELDTALDEAVDRETQHKEKMKRGRMGDRAESHYRASLAHVNELMD